jgi:two-component system, NtrC family, sensor kinase
MPEKFTLSKDNYQYLFDNASDAMWVHDLDGNIMIANKACIELTGYAPHELDGMNVSIFLTGEYLQMARVIKSRLLAGKPIAQPYEQGMVRKDGTTALLKISTTLFISEGKVVGIQNIARDITEEKRLRRNLEAYVQSLSQTQRLDELGKLAASVAHEINNPLAGVLVYNRLLSEIISKNLVNREDEIASIGKDMLIKLQKIDSAVTRCSQIARSLLDFGKKSEPTVGPVNISAVIDQSLALVGNQANLMNVEIVREDGASIATIMADFQQIQQVLVNLLMNAIQAMPRGGKLTIRSYVDGKWVKVSVQDTGQGISPKNIEKLFTPFYTTKTKGVGLGLAISSDIVERHNGKIEVQSKVGKGSTFTILLPVNKALA